MKGSRLRISRFVGKGTLTISGTARVILLEICSVSMPGVEAWTFTSCCRIFLVGEHHAEGFQVGGDAVLRGLIEALLLDADGVGGRLLENPAAAAIVIGDGPKGRQARLLDRDLSAGNEDAVLVDAVRLTEEAAGGDAAGRVRGRWAKAARPHARDSTAIAGSSRQKRPCTLTYGKCWMRGVQSGEQGCGSVTGRSQVRNWPARPTADR